MLDKPVSELEVEELNQLWTDGMEADRAIFAEMRTNLQLVAGQHYATDGTSFWNRIRDSKQLTEAQKLRITKNHTQRVTTIYRNSIESLAPDTAIEPANQSELQDQKSAELNDAYWLYIKACENFPRLRSLWTKHFVELGEVTAKIFWNTEAGQVIGYYPNMVLNPETGETEPESQDGEYIQDESTPAYSGKPQIETIEGYNLVRAVGVQSIDESPFLMIGKLIPRKSLRALFKDEKLIKELEKSSASQMVIYDHNSRGYKSVTDHILVKECYWRPAPGVSKGYYQFFTDTVITHFGELPGGIFPIRHENFDEQTGNPRGHAIIRAIRPPQVEINRCASKIAEHQITLGDDKAYISANTKLSQGATLPGIRAVVVSGVPPTVIEGRSGDQYLPYLEAQIKELYLLANLAEIVEEQPDSPDLYTNLFKSFRFKKKFTIYGERFERFLVGITETVLRVAKFSASEQELVPAIGRSEYINMSEFKTSEDLHYRIKIKPRVEDIESQFGKQLVLNNIMQYVGPQMDKADIGKLIRLSPFLNDEKSFEEFTNKYDRISNDILALDRGQWRPPQKYDDHPYIISMLSARMSKQDYEFLPAPIRYLYDLKIEQHEQLETQKIAELQRAQAGFIPDSGAMVGCDLYVTDPADPTKSHRLRLPSNALDWLVKALAKQGGELTQIARMPGGVQQDMAAMLMQSGDPNA